MTAEPHTRDNAEGYLETVSLVLRLHHYLLDSIKDELERRGRTEMNAVQALLLYNIGDKELSAGELRARGCYIGTNVSYNVKKLVDAGFLCHRKSTVDSRSVCISLTGRGRQVRDLLTALFDKHVRTIEPTANIHPGDVLSLNRGMTRLERFWIEQRLYRR